jgi:LAO/AO transport system kinase
MSAPATAAAIEARVAGVLAGDVRTSARLMRDLDDGLPSAREAVRHLHAHTGKAFVVGITGNPGSGKSTLTDQLIAHWRAEGLSVGVVAIDPTSPFTGGAILGDRVRMQRHATDEGVFIRSLATRGHLGGLSRSTLDVVRVLDAMGKDIVVIETVGVGQDEIEVTRAAHTSVVVVVPGLGDDIQAIKAGILEIADVFVVNKADRQGADRTVQELRMMLELFRPVARHSDARWAEAPRGVAQSLGDAGWQVPILKTVASAGEGIADVAGRLNDHRAHLEGCGDWARRERDRARLEFLEALKDRLVSRVLDELAAAPGRLDGLVDRIANRQADPYSLAEEVATAATGR